MLNAASAAMAAWCSSESTGSSVVQTTTTFICRRMPRHDMSSRASSALHWSQIPAAVCGLSKRSLIPSGRFSSRCVQ